MINEKSNNQPIIDKYGRKHNYLRISLTERCNLRCSYCMPENGVILKEKSKYMTSEEVIDIAKVFVNLGVTKIRLTGGEPLIKKNVDKIIIELSKLPIELSITTNAVNINQFIPILKKAKVKSINVSLDSLKEERFNKISKRNYFQRVVSNIKLLIKNNFNIKVNVVLIKGMNDDEICDFINWTIQTKINIRFIEFMPFDGNNWGWNKKISYNEILRKVEKNYGSEGYIKINDNTNDTSRNFKLKGSKGSFGIISTITNPFCDSCNRIRLTADGKIKNCLFSQNETNLLSALRQKRDLEEIIRKSIGSKHYERGGNISFEKLTEKTIKNRPMITIGG